MNEKELKDYKDFMYNECNCYNCDKCPENRGMCHESGNPCGQFRCWVEVHCKH